MMLYELLRAQWLVAALSGGLVLMLATVMTYLALWRGRGYPGPEDKFPPAKTLYLVMPAVLVFTYLGIVVFMCVAFTQAVFSPPNW